MSTETSIGPVMESVLTFRSIARLACDILDNRSIDCEVAEMLWAIQFMAERMGDQLDGVTS